MQPHEHRKELFASTVLLKCIQCRRRVNICSFPSCIRNFLSFHASHTFLFMSVRLEVAELGAYGSTMKRVLTKCTCLPQSQDQQQPPPAFFRGLSRMHCVRKGKERERTRANFGYLGKAFNCRSALSSGLAQCVCPWIHQFQSEAAQHSPSVYPEGETWAEEEWI